PRDAIPPRALERDRPVWRHRDEDLEAAEPVHALDRPRPRGAPGDAHRAPRASLRAHRQAVHPELDVDALGGGGAVAAPLAQRLEDGVARERLREHAGETAVRAERGRAGVARPRAALVAVGVGDEADLVALAE